MRQHYLIVLSALLWLMPASADGAEPDVSETVAVLVAGAGDSGAYVAVALEQSPAMREAHARWTAALRRVDAAGTLPEPTLSFGAFVRAVETRVGPQQARLSVQQSFPWPTMLTAETAAAQAMARAAERRLDAAALQVAGRVLRAYWSLWEIRAVQQTHRAHLSLLDDLAEVLRARLAVGEASLADLQQVDLSRARLADTIAGMTEQERTAEAALAAAVGLRGTGGARLPTSASPPRPMLPDEEPDALRAAALAHPQITGLGAEVDAATARVQAAEARRLPGVTVGADWILTGPAVMPDTEDSGKDAFVVGGGLRVPLWQRSYQAQVDAARADAEALRAMQGGTADDAVARVERAAADVRDSARRIRITRDTLLPQAEAAYASLLGSYSAGRSAVAQILLAQRELLELRIALEQANAAHARAWATLDEVCGRSVARHATEDSP